MTSEEIRKRIDKYDHETAHDTDALWEIALQLAVLNERNAERDDEGVRRILNKVGLDRAEPGKRDADREPFDEFAPPIDRSEFRHPFLAVEGNRFCGQCGGGSLHPIHQRAFPERS